ncbi:hypothetical protein RchiOBHm_Chr1g0371181 [Rosa chinensis]|uniref:RNase H type-1 domain-containing protein n=1 Tax=Rosa chinensis TaxID=74649 RepID=A0A2P6SLG8_ROSCH|nr:hypothetical protein RchiOBHm_Chr1g0371181 [Rosa chinensis]
MLMSQFDILNLKHIHREGNVVVDILAKESVQHASGICTFQSPPSIVVEALLDDI